MAGKSILPLVAIAGGAAFMLTKSKKKKKKTATAKKPPIGKDGVVASGSVDRVFAPKTPSEGLGMPYEWRVRKSNGDYLAEVGKKKPRDLKVGTWEEVGKADNMEDAKELAFAYIDKQPGFEFASTVVKSGRHKGAFDYIVREGEYSVAEGEGFADAKSETISGFIGEYRLDGMSKWVEAAEGEDMENVRILTMEAATIAANALGGGVGEQYPEHMREWVNTCEGEIAMLDMGDAFGASSGSFTGGAIVPYCPSATPGQTVTSGASENGNRVWRIQKTANPASPYVIQNNLSGDWEFVDSDVILAPAIIKGVNSIS